MSPMTREGTCQSLQNRALSLDDESKQRLYFTFSQSTDANLKYLNGHMTSQQEHIQQQINVVPFNKIGIKS